MSTDEIPEVTAYFEAVNAPAPPIQHTQACLEQQQRYSLSQRWTSLQRLAR